ncbi:Nicotinamide/nicotinic acid mononucleotide adenylyltransferase 1 [Diplonema papillatum]|nr:Nicotinamide/nicotinic acid mononucleotide adenylyltransferase 1 [Diplonema papillatum]
MTEKSPKEAAGGMGPDPAAEVPLGKLAAGVQRAPGSAKRLGVLLMSGSFSPLHHSHLACMAAARADPSVAADYDIVAGYLSPSSDEYVTHKLGAAALPLAARLDGVRAVASESDWLDVIPWGIASAGKTERGLLQAIRAGGLPPDVADRVRVLQVFGADHVVKWRLWNMKHPRVVCIARGEEDNAAIGAALAGLGGAPDGFYLVRTDAVDSTVSSTAIRHAASAGDAATLRSMLPSNVLRLTYPGIT